MHLSRLVLNPRNAGARQDAAKPYELHRTLMRGLEGYGDKAGERLLFRIEPERGPGGPLVLVQTIAAPSWSPLLENGYLLRADGPKPFDPRIEEGQLLQFRLVANPVVKKKTPGKRHSTRVPLIHLYREDNRTRYDDQRRDYEGYYDWLQRKSTLHGFTVIEAQDAPFGIVSGRRSETSTPSEKRDVPHFGVRFDGVLRVDQPGLLIEALQRGIGPAKAFGFGLLSLAPVSASE